MQIITIHGIRRQTKWYDEFKKLPHWENTGVKIENFEYGYFTMVQFLIPHYRRKVLREFQIYYSQNFNPNYPPNLICHSFGTYIFYSSIKKYKSIKFNKVILCGSILSRKIDWTSFFEANQVKYLLNDFGKLDSVVKFSSLIIRECGTSGQKGFLKVPEMYYNCFHQRDNYYEHSDYFLPLNMQENWAKLFIPEKRFFNYKKDILRTEIIDRIYKNICNENIEYSLVEYFGRIDERGNYFAHYLKRGINRSVSDLNELILTTTADSTNTEEDMWFKACDINGKKIDANIKNDGMQNKTFIISFPESIKKDEEFGVQYHFRWKETINIVNGDTDHFEIRDARDCTIRLNFTCALKSPRFFIVKDRNIVDEITPSHKTEKDKTTTYLTNYRNVSNNDGMIFYFEGGNIPKHTNKKLRLPVHGKKNSTNQDKITITKCLPELIKDVYKIELGIEFGNAASEITLKQRLGMFQDGFLVAQQGNELIGYIESVIWEDREFETFEEIKNFPLHYNVNGDTLYIIFLGVKETKRKNGVGKRLIEACEKVAIKYGVKKIKLVAKDDLLHYYKKFGFSEVRELPYFLEERNYKSVLMIKYLEI